MPVTALRWPLLACVALMLVGVVAEPAQAYKLTDWMRSWPSQWGSPQPVSPVVAWPGGQAATGPPVTLPPAVVLPPSAAVPAPPAYVAPPPAAAPPPTFVAPPAPSCSAAAVGCDGRGQAVVPMTSAPVAQAPPRSCCTSCLGGLFRMFHHPRRYQTSWARVPTTTFRPVMAIDPATGTSVTTMQPCTTYTWQVQRVPFFGWGAPQPFFVDGTAAPTGYMVSPAPGLIDGSIYAPAAPATPYYAPPATSPLTPPVPDATRGVPGASGWGTGSGADQRPMLTPGEAQGLQTVPSTSNYPPIPLSDPIERRWPANGNPPSGDPVQPVPDPDARPENEGIQTVPALFGPNDRTAVQRLHSPAVLAPIVWPDRDSPTDVLTASNDAREALRLEAPRIDTSQWRVVEP